MRVAAIDDLHRIRLLHDRRHTLRRAVHRRIVGGEIERVERGARARRQRVAAEIEVRLDGLRKQDTVDGTRAPGTEQPELWPRSVAVAGLQELAAAQRVVGPARGAAEHDLTAARQQNVADEDVVRVAARGIAGDAQAIADVDEIARDAPAADAADRQRFDLPLRVTLLARHAQREHDVRVLPAKLGDDAFDLGHRCRVEPRRHAVVGLRGACDARRYASEQGCELLRHRSLLSHSTPRAAPVSRPYRAGHRKRAYAPRPCRPR